MTVNIKSILITVMICLAVSCNSPSNNQTKQQQTEITEPEKESLLTYRVSAIDFMGTGIGYIYHCTAVPINTKKTVHEPDTISLLLMNSDLINRMNTYGMSPKSILMTFKYIGKHTFDDQPSINGFVNDKNEMWEWKTEK